jgi:arylsulfatase A-like enzyme
MWRKISRSGVLLIVAVGFAAAHAEAQTKPNIVLINADDLGYGDLGCYGATKVLTPNIDRLANEGRRFTDAHAASAVCSPSRYGLLTGRYPLRKNFWGPAPIRQSLTVETTHMTLASLLKSEGYETSCIGKWHLGFGEREPDWNGDLKPGPLELGFDYYFGIPSVNSGPPFVYVENHRVVGADPEDPLVYGRKSITKRLPEKSGYQVIGGGEAAHRLFEDELIGTVLKNKAVSWLKRRTLDKPFFLYLATTNIHHPFTPAKQFLGTSECGRYGDFIHELDWIVGEVLTALDEMKVTNNTLVIFTSDNGGMLHVTGQTAWKTGHRMNGILLGFKFGAWEGGHRVPMIARWPGKIPANTTSDCLISQVDLVATFAAIVDRPLKRSDAPDSINQLPNFIESPKSPIRETLIVAPNSPKHLSVRQSQWVYIPQRGAGGFQGKKPGAHLFAGAAALLFTQQVNSDIVNGKVRPEAAIAQLYDLENDRSQTTNIYSSHPEIVRELEILLNRYRGMIPSTKRLGWINIKQ